MILVVAIAVAVAASLLLDWVNFPAGALIGAMVAVAAFKLSGATLPGVPTVVRFAALIVIGWDLGSKFNKQLIGTVGDYIVPLVGVVAAFLIVSWLLAWILWKVGVMDPVTAVLATSPGGLVQMGALTSEMEANTALVVGFHLLRIVTVLLSVPLVSRFASN
jgi:membrane AbrB-like protein